MDLSYGQEDPLQHHSITFLDEITAFSDTNDQSQTNIMNYFDSPLSSPFLSSDLSSPDVSQNQYTETLLSDQSINLNLFGTNDFQNIQVSNNNEEVIQEGPTPVSNPIIEVKNEEEGPQPKKRGRKRQRKDPNESDDVSAVSILREDLLKYTSQQYDDLIKNITDTRSLTFAEAQEVKTQRRLIKNRESASASRQRKRNQMDDLSGENGTLKSENSRLTALVAQLTAENRSLRDEVAKLGALIRKTASPALAGATSSKIKGGLVLMIALFSFGLLFNGLNKPFDPSHPTNSFAPANFRARTLQEYDNQSLLQSTMNNKPRGILSTVTETPIPESSKGKSYSKLESAQATTSTKICETRDEPIAYSTSSFTSDPSNARIISSNEEPKVHHVPTPDAPIRAKIRIDTATDQMDEFSNESRVNDIDHSNITSPLIIDDARLLDWFEQGVIKQRKNTAYFTCDNLKQLATPNSEPFDEDGKFFVSFVVPGSALGNHKRPLISSDDSDNSIMEINCQVVDVNLSPIKDKTQTVV